MRQNADYKKLLLQGSATIEDAMRVMSLPGAAGMILIVDSRERLLGVVVDSDLRKAMLKGRGMKTRLDAVMQKKPFTLPSDADETLIREALRRKARALIPQTDKSGRVTGLIESVRRLASGASNPNWVVLLVGGLGSRLQPLTQKRPKPLLPVGNQPILETIIEQFVAQGFRNFILAVNHHADQIQDHFGDGGKWGASIHYIFEQKALGTAGALSLIRRSFSEPVIVMNGDVLTKVNFRALLDFHENEDNLATVCVREFDFQVPYGVVEIQGRHMARIVEKPTHCFLVNAGVYVLEPQVLSLIPKSKSVDMPSMLQKIGKKRRKAVGCFPIREYWIDIGRLPDYQRARAEFDQHF